MKLVQPQNFSTVKNIAKVSIVSSITVGGTWAICVPANAAFLYDTNITLNSSIPTFYGDVLPITGASFNTDFGANVMVSSSMGALASAPFFTTTPSMGSFSAPTPTATFATPTGSDPAFTYTLASDINFKFANGLDVAIVAGTIFNGSRNNSGVALSTIDATGSYFLNDGDKTFLTALSFGLNDIINTGGSSTYGLVASTGAPPSTAAPEPLTIVGTSLGTAAALRLRKKLAALDK